MATKTASKTDRINQIMREVSALSAAAEKSETGDFTTEERVKVKELLDEAGRLKAERDAAKGDSELRTQIKGFLDTEAALELNGQLLDGTRLGIGSAPAQKTMGQRFVDDERFKAYMSQFQAGIPSKASIQSPPVPLGRLKTLLTGGSQTSGGALVTNDQLGLVEPGLWRRPLTVRDLITVGQTDSDTVEFARMTGITNNAAPVAESTATANPDPMTPANGVKPESAMTFEVVSESVRNIAHWLPATTRALSDAGQLRTLIDEFLRYGIAEEMEDQIVSGSGTGQNFTGILETDGIQNQPWVTDIFVSVRKAITKARTVGRVVPSAVLVSPYTAEHIDLQRDGNERFYGNGPFSVGPNTLWGIPRVESEAMPDDTVLVGDFRWAVLWERDDVQVSASNSHADFFIRNMVAILAEMRAAFGVIRPQAFVAVDVDGISS